VLFSLMICLNDALPMSGLLQLFEAQNRKYDISYWDFFARLLFDILMYIKETALKWKVTKMSSAKENKEIIMNSL